MSMTWYIVMFILKNFFRHSFKLLSGIMVKLDHRSRPHFLLLLSLFIGHTDPRHLRLANVCCCQLLSQYRNTIDNGKLGLLVVFPPPNAF